MLRVFSLARIAVLLALAVFWLGPVRAAEAPVGDGDRSAIRAVIADQLAAFRRADGAAAFSFASPGIQRRFGDAANFMRMVETGYPPVYHWNEAQFGELQLVEGDLVQRVALVGADGKPVTALYVMQRQADGTWKINGCFLTESDDKTT